MTDSLCVYPLKTIEYKEAWQRQASLFEAMLSQKIQGKQASLGHLLFCEHPPVFTLGKNGKKENLLVSEDLLGKEGIQLFQTDRGGDITYHGYGQLVLYPILDLDHLKIGLREYVYLLEEVIIRSLAEMDMLAQRIKGASGIWIGEQKKICAIGIRASKGITMHGLALNVNTYLAHFAYITACGLEGKQTTSIQKEKAQAYSLSEISEWVLRHFLEVFGLDT